MTTYFISDIHLESNNQDNSKLFNKFLYSKASNADALYILGDFWEAWLGDDSKSLFINDIKSKLKKLAKDIPVYIMPGNRDFLLGKRFVKDIGATLLPDPCIVKIYGKQVILSHGDVFCTDDKDYQKYRKIIRNPFIKFLSKIIPFNLRAKIAKIFRQKSKEHTYNTKKDKQKLNFLDVNNKSILDLMKRLKIYTMIHGHTHTPKIHSLKVDTTRKAKRIVLGEWRASAYILSYRPTHSYSLEWFS